MKMRTLAKVLLAVLGVYLLNQIVVNLGMYLPLLFGDFMPELSPLGTFITILYSVFYIAFVIFLIFQLLFRGQKWAQKIVPTEEIATSQEQIFKLPAVFRLGLVLCGIFIICSVSGSIPRVIHSFFGSYQRQTGMPLTFHEWSALLIVAFRLAIGIYLVCGAPHFVRWQVKKTLKQCES